MSQSDAYGYEEHGNTVVWDMTAWSGDPDEIADTEENWLEVVQQPHVDGVVTQYGDDLTLGPEAQEHIQNEWSDTSVDLGIERSAIVADGIKAMAIDANLEVDGFELETFDDLDEAINWAQGEV